MTDAPENEAAKHALAEEQKATEKSKQQYADRMKGKPTPTQEENDLAACGAHFHEHEADGSDPDPNVATTRHMEAKKPAGGTTYTTRQSTAKPPAA
jgi:hypothetical protein